ncbi:MAG TPA: acyl-CoA dehydrogenase C-terminal domain-containing protein [Gemmatimonadales bacterium]|nr:acyl-CoA dehydrogenase C-terminal domain-containing protein [Gemmatimonadales bacterium]
MSQYRAPLTDMQFVMTELARLDEIAGLPGFEDATPDAVAAILDEAAKFATDVLDPLNAVGDKEGAQWREDGSVVTPSGFKDAYRRFCELGWNGLAKSPEFGGQGMPQLVAAAIDEMWNASNMAFELCPTLTAGAIEAIELNGSDALKHTYLPKMVSGEWTGTMDLTEPQAGSDLAAIQTKAVPQADGSYKLYGSKIFITYGEHDYTDNIIHLVLARTPDAPPGTKGISLFVVPKVFVNADGSLGERNDVRCVSIEHKLGIHGSPTAVLAFGDHGGAAGYLVGEENRGLEYMFVMMNLARFGVGMQGVAIADRAYQRAVAYARERVQGRVVGAARDAATTGIIGHPDVRRMLMTMRAHTEGARALAYVTAAALDRAHRHPDAETRKRELVFAELMIPIVKGWSTEMGQRMTSVGVQVHGGMGFIEETGAAQYARDARITTIYEGTTGIQANDLIGRKIARDGGKALTAAIATMRETERALCAAGQDELAAIGARLRAGIDALEDAGGYVGSRFQQDPRSVLAGAVPFLELAGIVCSGAQLGRAALIAAKKLGAGDGDAAFLHAKIVTARHFAEHGLTRAPGLRDTVVAGAAPTLALADEQF